MASVPVARWAPGDQLVIAWPGGAALVDAAVGLPAAERIWSRLRRDSQLATFLRALAEGTDSGFLELPSFAIVVYDEHRWHLAVRGAVPVEVQVAGQREIVSGEGITTWAERVLIDPEALCLGAVDQPGPGAPIADGVVPGGALSIGELVSAEPVAAPATPEPLPEPVAVPVTPEPPVVPEPPVTMAQAMIEEMIESASAKSAGSVEPPAQIPQVVPFAEPVPTPVAPSSSANTTLADDEEMSGEAAEVAAPAQSNPYDSLWDHSIAMDVEAAAIRGDAAEPTGGASASLAALGGQVGPSTSAPPADDQLFGDTVAEEGLVQVVMSTTAQGPQVLARFCDRGHANPPERANCFACGAPVAGDARTTTRPQLGWLRVEGGETIPLRGPVIAGRNPSSTALKLDETPRLVALPHPHVSSTHLAILIEGWHLMARDLRSSNGTFLRRHGKPAVRLPETAVPLVPGDLIDLGKGLFLHLDRTP